MELHFYGGPLDRMRRTVTDALFAERGQTHDIDTIPARYTYVVFRRNDHLAVMTTPEILIRLEAGLYVKRLMVAAISGEIIPAFDSRSYAPIFNIPSVGIPLPTPDGTLVKHWHSVEKIAADYYQQFGHPATRLLDVLA